MKFTTSRWFSLAEIATVAICCIALSIRPQLGWFPLIVAVLPLAVRLMGSEAPIQKTNFDIPILLFLLTTFVGFISAYNQELAFQRFSLIIGAALLFYALANQPLENLWLITTGVGAFVGFTVILFLLITDWSGFTADVRIIDQIINWWVQVTPDSAITPSFDVQFLHPNVIGGRIAILLPLCTATGVHYWQNKNRTMVGVTLGILLFLCLGFFFTSSRAAWGATLLGFGLLGVLTQARLRKYLLQYKNVFTLIVLLIMLTGVFAPVLLESSFGDSTNTITAVTSFSSRLTIAKNTTALIAEYPFFGGGLGSFPGLYSQYILVIPFFMYGYSHNLYLDLALEQGIIGLAIWMCITLICAVLIDSSIKNLDKLKPKNLFVFGLSASLIIMLIHGIADDPVYSNDWGIPFLFFLPGLSTAIANHKLEFSIKIERPFRFGMMGFVFLLVMLFIFSKPISATWHANIGAIKMAKIELSDWPVGEWDDGSRSHLLDEVKGNFLKALSFSPRNRSANYRLGLLSLSAHDFQQAAEYLETAISSSPEHRGIKKSLGYCYTWLGQNERAEYILQQIPEAHAEMEAYRWWWQEQGRNDLAENASQMAERLNTNQQLP